MVMCAATERSRLDNLGLTIKDSCAVRRAVKAQNRYVQVFMVTEARSERRSPTHSVSRQPSSS